LWWMPNNLDIPAELCLDPMLTATGVPGMNMPSGG